MKLGFVTAILPDVTFQQVLKFAADHDFSCVEVMCWPVGKADRKYAGVTHINVTALTKTKAEDILAQCQHHGVSISGLGYYPNPLDPNPKVARAAVSHLRKVIAAAPKLGLKNVNTFIGRDWTKSVDENWRRFLNTWKPLVRLAEDHDVKIGIENCPMLFTRDEWPGGKNLATSPEIWRRMFHDIPSKHFGLNFDPSHFALQFMDPTSALAEFKDKLFHLHAKDVKIDLQRLDEVGVFAEPSQWHQPRIPGFGEVNWPEFMGVLREVGYNGPVCIEVEDDTFGKSLAGRKKALTVAGNFLRTWF